VVKANENPPGPKPTVRLLGYMRNHVIAALKKTEQPERAREFIRRWAACRTVEEGLVVIREYVDLQ